MVFGLFRVIAGLSFIYLLWRNLKENYKSLDLINFGWLAWFGFWIAARISYGFINWGVWGQWWQWLLFWSKEGMNYFGAYVVLILLAWWYASRKKYRVIAFLEDVTVPFLVFLLFILIDDLIRGSFLLIVLSKIIALFVLIFISSKISRKYRSYVWYKSGKKGFVFWAINFLAMLFWTTIGLLFKIGWVYIFVYTIGCLLSLVGLFMLGEVWKKRK